MYRKPYYNEPVKRQGVESSHLLHNNFQKFSTYDT